MKATRPVRLDEGRLYLEVFYTFHKEQLEQDRYRKIIEEVMAQVLGEELALYLELGQKTKTALKKDEAEVVNVSGKVADDELVKAAEEIFG